MIPLPLLDQHRRPLRNLRLSVTDRCNLRCGYCMPEEEYTWLPKRQLLDFDELDRLVSVFLQLGVRQIRLTGGEPLLRRDLDRLVAQLSAHEALEDLALTTNAILLEDQAQELRTAGLRRLTISLDTLRTDRFQELTRRDELQRVLRGIEAAHRVGFTGTKLNTVVLRGSNDDELVELLEFAEGHGLEARFIEYMDVGGATQWDQREVVSRVEILERLEDHYGPIEHLTAPGSSAPAQRYRLPNGQTFGIIASTTAPFCGTCDRSRLTADGKWFTCLYGREGLDLAEPLRSGASDRDLRFLLGDAWNTRDDRGAEQRLEVARRDPLASASELRADPHLEMHTRGG